jgi:hypothetical protein
MDDPTARAAIADEIQIAAHQARCKAAEEYVPDVRASTRRRGAYYVRPYTVLRGPEFRPGHHSASGAELVVAVSCTCPDWEFRSGIAGTASLTTHAVYGCKHMIAVNYATGATSPSPATTYKQGHTQV